MHLDVYPLSYLCSMSSAFTSIFCNGTLQFDSNPYIVWIESRKYGHKLHQALSLVIHAEWTSVLSIELSN